VQLLACLLAQTKIRVAGACGPTLPCVVLSECRGAPCTRVVMLFRSYDCLDDDSCKLDDFAGRMNAADLKYRWTVEQNFSGTGYNWWNVRA
jgi:hypothetical protein